MREIVKMVRPEIVLFGDSIVEDSFAPGGWGASLAHTFSRKADVVFRGYDRWASLLLNQLFPLNGPTAPCATIIFFGANDSALLGSASQRQHVPQDQYKDNLRKIVTHLKALSPAMVVVLVTPLPVDEFRREQHARYSRLSLSTLDINNGSLFADKKKKLPDQTNEMTGSYAGQCLEVAQEMHLPWIDLWFTMQQISDWKKLFLCSDGSQLTEEGNALVHREVVQVLIEAGINAQDMQMDCPHHFEIEETHPEHAFQQDIYASHLVDLDYEDDFVAEMVIPCCTEDSKLMSTPLQTAPAFEFDPHLVPLPDDAFFPSSSCATSSGGHSSSYMVDPTRFTEREEIRCQQSLSIQIKEEPLSFVVPDSSMSLLTHIKKEHSDPPTPPKEDVRIGLASASKKVGKGSKKKKPKRKGARPLKKSKATAKEETKTTAAKEGKPAAKMCMHCQTTKTPQWRAGPEGAKTLCNACGVRYRLGRLYPEYRPIHSPTFVPELHSNSHREIAKMRRLKEGQVDWVES